MISLILNVEATVGSDITDTAKEMIRLAIRTDCMITLDFNGQSLVATGSSNPIQIVNDYHKSINTCRDRDVGV